MRNCTLIPSSGKVALLFTAALLHCLIILGQVPSCVGVPPLAGGTYTINSSLPASAGNFRTFASAVSALQCGIAGAVVFNVSTANTTYNEQIIIRQVPGASASRTITFNGNGNTLAFTSSNPNEMAVLKLDGADHFVFDNLNITANGLLPTEYGFGVQLLNNADSNTFRKCNVNSDLSSSSTNFAGIVISSSHTSALATGATLCDGNLFEDNTIRGGYYGVSLVGGTGNLINGNRFINNTVSDFYQYGFYVSFTTNSVFERNRISRPKRSIISTFYGMSFISPSENTTVSKNIISSPTGLNNASPYLMYGIFMNGCNGTLNAPNLFSNNLIYDFNGAAAIYALYNRSSAYSLYFHNTISLDNKFNVSTAITRAFHQEVIATGVQFKNNIVSITRTGGGANHIFYLPSVTADFSDNNDLFMELSPRNNTAYVGTVGTTGAVGGDYGSLVDWQLSSGLDLQSVALDPRFIAPTSGNFIPSNAGAWNDLGVPKGILTDLNGSLRSPSTPDLGAYENAIPVCTSPPLAGKVNSSITTACFGSPFMVFLKGGSSGTGQTYQWQSSRDNITFTNISAGAQAMLTTTQVEDSLYYRAQVTCGAVSTFSDTLKIVGSLCYCASAPNNNQDAEIYNTTFNGVSINSDCSTLAPGAGSIPGRYSNYYPNGPLTSLVQGALVPFSVTHNACGGRTGSPGGFGIWIDFNRDGDFDDAGEKVFTDGPLKAGPRTVTGNIAIPLSASPGVTGMRIVLLAETITKGEPVLLPCTSYSSGETEDYLIKIGAAVACSGVPVGGQPTSSKAVACPLEKFTLLSAGSTVATGLAYQWQSSPDNNTWTNIAGAIKNSLDTSQTVTKYYRVRLTCINGGAVAFSSSVLVTTPNLVSGTYTINSGLATGGTNFRSYNDAYSFIKCGINGPVVFNVQPGTGPYNEQLIIDPIPGANALNKVIFNGNGTVLVFRSNNTNERSVIKFNGADHITFDSLVINATGSGTQEYGYGVQFLNDADSNVVKRCRINIGYNALSTPLTVNYAGVVISSANTAVATGLNALCDGNVIDGNEINGGYYGMTMVGGPAATVTNKYTNNTIRDFYSFGIYLAYSKGALIEGNSISRPARTALGAFNGIYLATSNPGAVISRNRIFNTSGGNKESNLAQNGISFVTSMATQAEPAIVANNLLYDFNGEGTIYAIYNTSGSYASYYNNTIALNTLTNNSSAITRGFFQTGTAAGIAFKNNIVSIFRTGNGINHAIYLATPGNGIVSDYNNYFLANSASNFIGFSGGVDYADLNAWQASFNPDLHSVIFDPEFEDISAGNYRPLSSFLDNLGTPISQVPVDINNTTRSLTTPDIGAYEYAPVTCTNPPVPGNLVSNVNPVCLGVTFTIAIQGGQTGSGQTYQWQSSENNTDWTNIAGAVTRALTSTQTRSTYYRVIYTCGVGVPSASIRLISPALVSGVYTINSNLATGGSNFKTFNDAYSFLRCGINGPIVFNVAQGSGPYKEQLIMQDVPGASAINTITFNGNSNTLQFAPDNTDERAVIKLRGAKYIRFNNLIIDGSSGVFGYGIQLLDNADYNIVNNCTINVSERAITDDHSGIVISGVDSDPVAIGNVLSDYNSFINNRINGGYYGITLAATFTGGANGGNIFKGNDIRNFYRTGMYVAGSYGTVIDSNSISRPDRQDGLDFTGILFTTQKNTGCTVSRNRISNPFGVALVKTGIFYGIYFLNSDGSIGGADYNENTISNNLIYNVNGEGPVYGIANTGSDYAFYYHNTISLDNANSVSSDLVRGFSQITAAGGVVFMNNLISITAGGTGPKHCIYLGAGLPLGMDYNDYYLRSTAGVNRIGYYLSDRTLLQDWIGAVGNGLDRHSVVAPAAFIDPVAGDYTPGNAGLDNKGVFAGITNDIINAARNNTNPDIGAYEFNTSPCSLPLVNGKVILPSASLCQNSPVFLGMNIAAYGSSQTFQWQTSVTANGPFVNLGAPLLSPDTLIYSDSVLYYRVAITCGASTVYSDTGRLLVNPALPGGIYTINKGAGTTYIPGVPGGNFNSFAAAKQAMICGITRGAVIFNVVPGSGPYVERLTLDSIPGTSATSTVTFNGNGNTITINSDVATDRSVITLNGTDYFIFDSLNIDAGTGAYGYGVQLINNADYNTFRKNTIRSSTSAITTNYAGVVINATAAGPISTGATLCDFNSFESNTIIGGNSGITLVGSATSESFVNGNKFSNNNIRDFYSFGLYLTGTANTRVEGNTFSRPVRNNSAATVYGIYLATAASHRLSITKNRFTNFFGGLPSSVFSSYAVYYNSVDAVTGHEDTVSNNLVYGMNGNGAIYAFYNSGSNNVYYYHNTISLDNTSSTTTQATAAIYQNGDATGLQFRNNIITISRGGTGTKHAIYLISPATIFESASNNIYMKGANSFAGYAGGANRLTIADLAAATGQNRNSFAYDPIYADSASGNFRPLFALLDNLGEPLGIRTDITNANRSLTVPDMGAYEFTPATCANPLIPGIAKVTPVNGLCLESPVQLTIAGHSPLGSVTFQWESSADGVAGWAPISPVQYITQYDTLATTSTYYRAKVSCGSTTVYTNVVSISLNNLMPAGTYTINNAAAATYTPNVAGGNFQSFATAIAAMQCGIRGRVIVNILPGNNGIYNEQVVVPYIPGTSTASTITFQSASGVAGSVNLSYAGTATRNYTLRLDSAKNVNFKNLTITAENSTYGRAIEILNGAASDSLVNSVINVPAANSATNTITGIYANGLKGQGLVIKGNTITNGVNGISLSGVSTAAPTIGHEIDSNIIRGTYSHAIQLQSTAKMKVTRNRIDLSGSLALDAAAISINAMDSASVISSNQIDIHDISGTAISGIVITGARAVQAGSPAVIAGNRITAGANIKVPVYGITLRSSRGLNVINNVIAINSASDTAYGLYHQYNTGEINYFNNTVNLTASSKRGFAGYFAETATASFSVKNNIFSNKGGGKALFVSNPLLFDADYNMLYSSGDSLVVVTSGVQPGFTSLRTWKNTWNWDANSISYEPAFADNIELKPALSNPNSWAMHGRGVQIPGNDYDFNRQPRVTQRQLGVPDLGAYEFYPTALPTVLLATPSVPAPNSTQVFSYGTDTVMKVTWLATAPSTVSVRRYSGVVPPNLPAGMDSMYFYTQVDIPGTNDYRYNAKIYYVNSWQGSIPDQSKLGMGRTTPGNAWVVGSNSFVNVKNAEIGQDALLYLDKFTGLVNQYAAPDKGDSSSNRGKDFWVGYQRTNGFGSIPSSTVSGTQTMKIYMGAGEVPANVTISIEGSSGTPWIRTYHVPANSAVASDVIPTTGANDAKLLGEGLFQKRGIHITSDVSIVAYAHIYESTNSGATLLMPTSVWGYEYYSLSSRQYYTTPGSASAFHIVAQHDNTWVEINPSRKTESGWIPNGGTRANKSYLVKLNKGDAYQVLGANLSGAEGQDLTGSYIKSVSNDAGDCYPIGVFAGSTRTAIGCGSAPGNNGDLIIQQVFPYQAWGTKYVTAPTTMIAGPSPSLRMTNIYRILVKDPATIVKRNNVQLPLTNLIDGKYYQFESSTGDVVESNKPVMVAQFMSSSGMCNSFGDTDPEMFYLSPLQQSIKKTQFYRNNKDAIVKNFITLVIPTEGLNTLKIDNIKVEAYDPADREVYAHPNMPGYSIVTKTWQAEEGSSMVESEYPFTGVVYGMGYAESYGYNIGTQVKNLNNLSSINTSFNTGANPTEYTCKGSPFKISVLLPISPTSILWQFSKAPKLSPNRDSLQTNPVATDTVDINGVTYYAYTIAGDFVIDTAGFISIPVQYSSPQIEKCTQTEMGNVILQVLPAPITDFTVAFPGGGLDACQGSSGTFSSNVITANGIALNGWEWTFPGNAVRTGKDQTFTFSASGTFPVKLKGTTADGCVSETIKNIVINPAPVVSITRDSIPTCVNVPVTFMVTSPIATETYNWYTAPTGGTSISTGVNFTTPTGAPLPSTYYAEARSDRQCTSLQRKKVTMYAVAALQAPVVTTVSTPVSITFTWSAVPGADTYEVSVDGGVTYVVPSSGITGLTHVITGLTPATQVTLRVRATGIAACQTSTSEPVTGKTMLESIFIPNMFSPNGDGKNDVLTIYGYTIKEIRFMVFNQWGEKVAETNASAMDASGGRIVWDGKHGGTVVPLGVYIYASRMVMTNGTVIEKKGTVAIIR